MSIPTPYEDLLADVLANGTPRADRTGTGTIGVFGRQIRFDLSQGFPLITTKKVFTRGIFEELLWFLAGDTRVKTLQDKNVHIWDQWVLEDGTIGPGYSHQWVRWGAAPTSKKQPVPQMRPGVPRTYLGVGNGQGGHLHPLKKTWEGMMARCYDPSSISYSAYGGKGVAVCDRWLEFTAFAEDVVLLPGYEDRQASGAVRYVLDKDLRGDGFTYDAASCMWITDAQNSALKFESRRYTVERADGQRFTFSNVGEFCQQQGIPRANFTDLWTGNKSAKERYGFRLISAVDRKNGFNQIEALVEGIKNDPFSRRHIVNAWNVAQIDDMALPPCHTMFQFHVTPDSDGKPWKLNCQLYQRSGDLFLGVPFNIASYAALTHMIAQQTGLEVGEFIHTFGDAHIYKDHIDQVKEQLTREARPYPELKFNRIPASIFDYRIEDFEIIGYDPHPSIKAPVSV